MAYTLTVMDGSVPYCNGIDLADPISPIKYRELDADTQRWLAGNDYDTDHPDVWVLVTPANEDTNVGHGFPTRNVKFSTGGWTRDRLSEAF